MSRIMAHARHISKTWITPHISHTSLETYKMLDIMNLSAVSVGSKRIENNKNSTDSMINEWMIHAKRGEHFSRNRNRGVDGVWSTNRTDTFDFETFELPSLNHKSLAPQSHGAKMTNMLYVARNKTYVAKRSSFELVLWFLVFRWLLPQISAFASYSTDIFLSPEFRTVQALLFLSVTLSLWC